MLWWVRRPAFEGGKAMGQPFIIRAIGNSRELRAALEMPEGIAEKFGLKGLQMILIKETPKLELPAFANTRAADSASGQQHNQTAANR